MFQLLSDPVELSDSMLTRAVDSITYDPLAAIRADYAQLKAHYKMLFAAGSRHAEEARTAAACSHEYYAEAEQIHEQMSVLERKHPELVRI